MTIGIVHLGASSLSLALVDQNLHNLQILQDKRQRLANGERKQQTYDQLLNSILEVFELAEQLQLLQQISALIVTSPTPVTWPHGRVGLCPGMPALKDRPLLSDIQTKIAGKYGISPRVLVENDANAAAIQWALQSEEGDKPHFHCRLSTGVGGCIMWGGQPYRGHCSLAGEIGHVTIQPFGLLCGCGNVGCLETVCGGNALQRMYAEIAGNKQTHFMDLLDQWQTESIDLSLQLELMGKYLGIAIASATNLLNPAFVVVSGPLLDARDVLRHSLESEFSQRVCASLECPLMFAAADHNDPFHAGVAVYRNWQSQQPPHVIHN